MPADSAEQARTRICQRWNESQTRLRSPRRPPPAPVCVCCATDMTDRRTSFLQVLGQGWHDRRVVLLPVGVEVIGQDPAGVAAAARGAGRASQSAAWPVRGTVRTTVYNRPRRRGVGHQKCDFVHLIVEEGLIFDEITIFLVFDFTAGSHLKRRRVSSKKSL